MIKPRTALLLALLSACAEAQLSSVTTLEVTDATTPPVAQTYYISCVDGNDTDDGMSPTNAWATISRANSVQPHANGHVDILVAPCEYRNQVYTPQNGGTDATHKIRLRPHGTGAVRLLGPSSGRIRHVLFITVPWIEVMRESNAYFEIDGEVVFGSGGGQVEKGEDPDQFAHVLRGAWVEASNVTLDVDLKRVGGWTTIDQGPATGATNTPNLTLRINCEQMGTPFYPGDEDYADAVFVPQQMLQTHRMLIDGGATGRSCNRGGHASMVMYGGTGTLRNYSFDGDGNRGTQFVGRNALDWHAYNVVWQRGGQPADQPRVELTKIEGTRTSISDCVGRNADHNVFEIATAAWSWKARALRISHCVFDNIPGLVVSLRDYECEPGFSDPSNSPPSDIRLYNLILKNVSTNPEPGFANMLMDINLCDGTDWRDVIFAKGITLEDESRDAGDFIIRIFGGTDPPGARTVAWYLKHHPDNFSDWTFTSDANLDNAPAYGADVSLVEVTTEYGPVDDTLSTGTGVTLTQSNGAGSNSTALVVNDASWFDDPSWGPPGFGQQSEGFFVHLQGVGNVEYTAVTREPWPSIGGTLTLAGPRTWEDNAGVNKRIYAAGAKAAPNRGVKR
jgi:hypothetical protein